LWHDLPEEQLPMTVRPHLFLLFAALLVGCGGSGSSSTPKVAPSDLSYPSPPAFTVGQAIAALTPTVTGTVVTYAVSPALPAGLSLDGTTGVISGTPTAPAGQASYTITASNITGSTTAKVTIVVNDVGPTVTYSSPYYSFTNGVAAQTAVPKVSGGAVVNWSVSPALPAGLTLSSTDGSISGTPSASAAPTSYVVTATNSGGHATATLTLAVSSGPILDLGHGGDIQTIRMDSTHAFSQDLNGHWVLWNFATAATVASGTAACQTTPCRDNPFPVDLAGPTIIIGTPSGFDVRSSATGQLVASVAASVPSWHLASDGSYVCAGTSAGLMAWSPSGQLLFSRSGDYSSAAVAAVPGAILVALGPAGQNVVETVSVMTGASAVGPPFSGQFSSWFADGSRFLTTNNVTNMLWVYSSASVQQDARSLPALDNLAGTGNWFWTLGTLNNTLNIYAVGASATPAASYVLGIDSPITPSGDTLGANSPVSGQFSVIDLSGAVPSKVDYAVPVPYIRAYAALSSSQWMVGNFNGVLLDGSALPGTVRYFGHGRALSIAGGTGSYAIATAIGEILYFDSATNAAEGKINFLSSNLAFSSDGTVLAAEADITAAQFEPDRTLNIYSLPSGTLLNSFAYTVTSDPSLQLMTLSGSGTVLGEVLVNDSASSTGILSQAVSVNGGTPSWSSEARIIQPVLLSPDGTLVAVSNEPPETGGGISTSTNIYKNGVLSTSLSGWAVGWIDNGRLLVNSYDPDNAGDGEYIGANIYSPSGNLIASPSVPELLSFQTVDAQATTPNLLYSPNLNSIISVSSGATTWTSGSPAGGGPQVFEGAVAADQIVFQSGNLVLAEPH
jgi:hypothetical protein